MPAIYTKDMIDKLKAKALDEKVKKQIDEMLGKEHQEGGPITFTPGPKDNESAWYIVYGTSS